MPQASVELVEISASGERQPRDDELDLFGLTHLGRVRSENQDQFLVCTVHPQVVVHGTSLPDADQLPLRGERLATLLLVADGVGGADAGRDASAIATRTITRYVASSLRCYHAAGSSVDTEFAGALRRAALEAHEAVLAETAAQPDIRTMATTLTLAIAVWPSAYVVQVGDSRCYHYSGGALQQITRDQTMAQWLVDGGVMAADDATASPLANVLSSAIGGEDMVPVVVRLELQHDSVLLLCSDGLTKHVTDDEIAEVLRRTDTSEQACRALVVLVLERGGSDNITVLVRKERRR